MKLSKLKYSLSQAKKNIFRNGLMTIASLFTVTCCLLILGLFTVLSLNVNYITNQIKDECEVQVYIEDGTDEERVSEIGDEILKIANVKEISLFTKEDSFNYVVDDMFEGDKNLASGLEEAFRDSYKVTMVDIEKSGDTIASLEQIKNVAEVQNKQDAVNVVISFSNVVKKLSIVVMILLLIVAIVIMANTIRLTVFNRRKEINIMKYIGATDRFIRIPFVIEGIMIGFFGALISFGIMSWGYVSLANYVTGAMQLFDLLPYKEIAPIFGGLFVITGCFIGMIGSLISMRKYLNV